MMGVYTIVFLLTELFYGNHDVQGGARGVGVEVWGAIFILAGLSLVFYILSRPVDITTKRI